jgi:hypothetical protein
MDGSTIEEFMATFVSAKSARMGWVTTLLHQPRGAWECLLRMDIVVDGEA